MNKQQKIDITKALAVTCEMCGGVELTSEQTEIYIKILDDYEFHDVQIALDRCLKEVKGRIAPADIIKRISSAWPTPDEAWALCPNSEAESTVWFDECASAWGATEKLDEDPVARRMAFKDAYSRELAMTKRKTPEWWPSLGHCKRDRARVIEDAIARGRLAETNRALLPHAEESKPVKQLEADVKSPSASQVSSLRELLGAGLSQKNIKKRVEKILGHGSGETGGEDYQEPSKLILTAVSDGAPEDTSQNEREEHEGEGGCLATK